MNKNNNKKKNGNGPVCRSSSRTQAYVVRRAAHPLEPRARSASIVGYSPSTTTTQIESTIAYELAAQNVIDQRSVLQHNPKYTFAKVADTAMSIIDDSDESGKVRVSAIKEFNSMMGYNAPEQVEVKTVALTAELKDMSIEKIRAAINKMKGDDAK